MDRMDTRAVQRVGGPAWEQMRLTFEAVSERLLGVCPTATGELISTYVKYASELETKGQPYAVVWLKKASEIVIGLALPEPLCSPKLTAAPPRHVYKGLTGYLTLRPGEPLPDELTQWACMAFESRKRT